MSCSALAAKKKFGLLFLLLLSWNHFANANKQSALCSCDIKPAQMKLLVPAINAKQQQLQQRRAAAAREATGAGAGEGVEQWRQEAAEGKEEEEVDPWSLIGDEGDMGGASVASAKAPNKSLAATFNSSGRLSANGFIAATTTTTTGIGSDASISSSNSTSNRPPANSNRRSLSATHRRPSYGVSGKVSSGSGIGNGAGELTGGMDHGTTPQAAGGGRSKPFASTINLGSNISGSPSNSVSSFSSIGGSSSKAAGGAEDGQLSGSGPITTAPSSVYDPEGFMRFVLLKGTTRPTQIVNDRDLVKVVGKIATDLAKKSDWEARTGALISLQRLAWGNLTEYKVCVELIKGLNELVSLVTSVLFCCRRLPFMFYF
jgi:hypothetical protein